MTFSIAPDYSQITFTLETRPDTSLNMLLTFTKNCGDEIELSVSNTDVITVTADDLYSGSTTIPDGVYNFIISYDGDEEVFDSYTEQACVYIGTTSRCKAKKYFESTGDVTVRNIIKALELTNQCDDCDCAAMCTLYEVLLDKINVTLKTTTYVYNDCGCN